MKITIDLDDVVNMVDETLHESIADIATEKYTPVAREIIKRKVKQSLEKSEYQAFVNAIAQSTCLQILNELEESYIAERKE